jgi:peptidoglycan/xylan/chitin deacetylase (PgdA/CDA1 family)
MSEFSEWEAISKPVIGVSDKRIFRPPYLVLNNNVRTTAERSGYQIVMGESSGDAIPGITLEEIKTKTLSILTAWNEPKPCVLIFHDNRPTTYQSLGEIINNLQQQGFLLVHFDPSRL